MSRGGGLTHEFDSITRARPMRLTYPLSRDTRRPARTPSHRRVVGSPMAGPALTEPMHERGALVLPYRCFKENIRAARAGIRGKEGTGQPGGVAERLKAAVLKFG